MGKTNQSCHRFLYTKQEEPKKCQEKAEEQIIRQI